jgi:YbgC/YbaW family acyl-CoA thioester hydrolase
MTLPVHEYKCVIQKNQIDLNGHVNHAKYLEIMEEARWALVNKAGITAETVMAQKVGPVILEVTIKFKHELKLGEKIRVLTQVPKPQAKIGYFEQQILNESGQEAASAVFTWAIFDLNQRKLIDFTPKWLETFGF